MCNRSERNRMALYTVIIFGFTIVVSCMDSNLYETDNYASKVEMIKKNGIGRILVILFHGLQ